ncbi:hypothetical protein BLOT_015685 [Blomia tropicalis]|nr:hypothetical protein BLOT_015685 [Blomia tropicalis]
MSPYICLNLCDNYFVVPIVNKKLTILKFPSPAAKSNTVNPSSINIFILLDINEKIVSDANSTQ